MSSGVARHIIRQVSDFSASLMVNCSHLSSETQHIQCNFCQHLDTPWSEPYMHAVYDK